MKGTTMAADLDTAGQMKDRTASHIAAVYGAVSATEGELVGSGTFLDLWGETWLLSADHVLREKVTQLSDGSPKYLSLACSNGNGEPPNMLPAPCYGWAAPLDVAATLVENESTRERVPLPARFLGSSSIDVENAILFVHGFPGDRSRAFSFGVASKTLPYRSGPGRTPRAAWFDSRFHFSVDYHPQHLVDERGFAADFVMAGGLSGSAVWAVNRCADVHGWSPGAARVVGIVTHWDQDDRVLIATRVEVVRELLLAVLRQRHAHARWESRGSPIGDDWSDWFHAVDEMEGLVLTTTWLRRTFESFDEQFFGGQLAIGTQTESIETSPDDASELEDCQHGACKNDGSIIYVNVASNHDWRCTLLHEMTHAFEYRFPSHIAETEEARHAERTYGRNPFVGPHSAKFFAKLFEIMRLRGHDPKQHFDRYFA